MNQPVKSDNPGGDVEQQEQNDPQQEVPESAESWTLRKYDHPAVILLLLFFVTGALGLPVVWYSKSFSSKAKIAISIIVTIYTIALLASFFAIMAWVVNRIGSAF